MSATDALLDHAERYAATFAPCDLPTPPARKVAIVACMDARIDLNALFALSAGDAHVIRNAGGVITDDQIRSLAISQRLLGTEEIILVHHTDCGLLKITDDSFRRQIREEIGIEPPWATEAFTDLDADVRRSIARVLSNPFVPAKWSVRGFVYDVRNGTLREVTAQ